MDEAFEMKKVGDGADECDGIAESRETEGADEMMTICEVVWEDIQQLRHQLAVWSTGVGYRHSTQEIADRFHR